MINFLQRSFECISFCYILLMNGVIVIFNVKNLNTQMRFLSGRLSETDAHFATFHYEVVVLRHQLQLAAYLGEGDGGDAVAL